MSVFDNIAFPLQIAKVPKAETQKRVVEAARILELEQYLKRRPGQLSGGQRQRVAMGRAIVRQPSVYLMDEPLSNLDAKLRVQMRAEIAQLQHRLGTTTIYVTHDQVEAMTMGHRVALLRDGILQQVDTPSAIYDRPRNLFVAAFIGSPTMNLYYADLAAVGAEGATVQLGSTSLGVPASVLGKRPGLSRYAGRRIVVGIRPEDLADATLRHDLPPGGQLESEIELVEALGSDVLVHFGIDAPAATVQSSDSLQELKGKGASSRVVARLTPKSQARLGGPVAVAIDTERLQFFDADSGEAIWD
jgi:multiple sugar transport system ATP-binding protein